jgi:hypothetical protein
VTQGQADIAAAQATVRQQQALQASRAAEGTQFRETELVAAQRRLDDLQERVVPFEQELSRRAPAKP